MNRERLLFAGVLAIFALWFFVMREPPGVSDDVNWKDASVTRLDVQAVGGGAARVRSPEPGVFTLVTNERPHPRPALPLPKSIEMPNIWLPTSRTVALDKLGMLRRESAPVQDGEATIRLPDLGESGGTDGAADDEPARKDRWSSNNRDTTGSVFRIRYGGQWIKDPGPDKLPKPGQELGEKSFHRLLALLEVDPDQLEQVTDIEVALAVGKVTQPFPSDINSFEIAIAGRHKSYYDGLKGWLRLPSQGYDRHQRFGQSQLERGRQNNDRVALRWAQAALAEARARVNTEAREVLRTILLDEMEAATLLQDQELLLRLAFAHLSRFPDEEEVLERVGTLLASRSFGLLDFAEDWFARAASRASAQKKRVEVLIQLGRFDEAGAILDSGRAGGGAEVDLLASRVALAQGDFETARRRASAHTGGARAADAHLVLGGIAYAQGNASEAESHFQQAVERDSRRSRAYSDLGLALAVQGRAADARVCFERAAALDFENTVIPGLGSVFLKLRADDVPGATDDLKKLQDNNPRDLLVRYYLGYARERAGDLSGAHDAYRSVLDNDHRYRVAIARLGLVQSRQAPPAGSNGGSGHGVDAAVAHLAKAVALNPDDAALPYILGRFLMDRGIERTRADRLFGWAAERKAPESEPDLRFWAQAARAALLYRDESVDELKVKAGFGNVISEIKDQVRRQNPRNIDKALEAHPVHQYAARCRDIVSENEQKVDVIWEFQTRPRDWAVNEKNPMRITFPRTDAGVVEFRGTIDYSGKSREEEVVLRHGSFEYSTDKSINGKSFYEAVWEGEIPAPSGQTNSVDVGFGIVTTAGRRGNVGIQVRRKYRGATLELKLDGPAEEGPLKQSKGRDFVELPKVSWPAGPFRVRILVSNHDKGNFRLFLSTGNGPEINVLETEFGYAEERCSLFGRRGNRPLAFYMWVEGNEGVDYQGIQLDRFRLTKAK